MSDAAFSAYAALLSLAPSLNLTLGPPEALPHYDTAEPALSFLVGLRFSAEDAAPPHSASAARLISGLHDWAETWARQPQVDLLLCLPSGFPACPPEVRVLRPLLEPGTGGVLNGFLLGVPELFYQAWSPQTQLLSALPEALGWVRGCLLRNGARVNGGANANYTLDAYRATRRRALLPPSDAWAHSVWHRSRFSKHYTIFSSAFAQLFMSMDLPPGFDAGGKALLPMSALELVMRSELREGLEAGGAAGWLREAGAAGEGGSGGGGGGASARTPRGADLSSLLSVAPEESSTGESAMLFAIYGAMEAPVYVGVREFTAPDPTVIIVPPETLANLGVPEGSAVCLYRVELPQITSMVLQPHAEAFLSVQKSTGMPPREFLEESFSNFSALQPGVTILCDGGMGGGNSIVEMEEGEEGEGEGEEGEEPLPTPRLSIRAPEGAYRFSVISIKPAGARAGALFAGFSSSISIEFLPAADLADDMALSPLPNRDDCDATGALQPHPYSPRSNGEGGGSGGGGFESMLPVGIGAAPLAFDAAAAAVVAAAAAAKPVPPPVSAEERRRLQADAAERRMAAAAAAAAAAAGGGRE